MIDQDEQKLIIGEDYFLEHYGKKGMKWGQRRAAQRAKITARTQKRLDSTRRVAAGKGSKTDKFVQSMFRVPVADLILGKGVKGGSQRLLKRHQKIQTRVLAGEAKTREVLSNALGLRYRDLNFDF